MGDPSGRTLPREMQYTCLPNLYRARRLSGGIIIALYMPAFPMRIFIHINRPHYNLMNTAAAAAPNATAAPGTPQRSAPACILSKGLPLLVDVFCGAFEVVVDDAACGCCSTCVDVGADASVVGLGEAEAEPDDCELVALAFPSRVDVTVLPKLMVLGPITTGTIISSVCPSPFVVVLVAVEVKTSVNSSPPFVVDCGLFVDSECST